MSTLAFKRVLMALGTGFALFFAITIVPPLLRDLDVWGAAMAGFVNPYAAGYSTDTIMCWLVLAAWVWHDRSQHGIRHGWVALLLGAVPGVATGLSVYLLMRLAQKSD
jgi:hypothetical protein